MMNAYDKDYLYHSQKNFGHLVDFAVNTCDYDIDEFFNMFLASNVCVQFESGNPAYIAGKTGCDAAPTAPINVVVKPPIKVNIITPFDHSSLESFRAEMRKTTAGKLFDVFSKPEMLEFSHLQSNKGDAVRFMADFYGVPMGDTIAVGDEENDCPMIEAAGVGVAMANASQVVKDAADYVTERDNNHSGIAEVIEKFVLGDE